MIVPMQFVPPRPVRMSLNRIRFDRGARTVRYLDGSLHHLLRIHGLLHAAVHRNLVDFVEVLPMQADQIRAKAVAALRIQAIGGFPVCCQNDQITE